MGWLLQRSKKTTICLRIISVGKVFKVHIYFDRERGGLNERKRNGEGKSEKKRSVFRGLNGLHCCCERVPVTNKIDESGEERER